LPSAISTSFRFQAAGQGFRREAFPLIRKQLLAIAPLGLPHGVLFHRASVPGGCASVQGRCASGQIHPPPVPRPLRRRLRTPAHRFAMLRACFAPPTHLFRDLARVYRHRCASVHRRCAAVLKAHAAVQTLCAAVQIARPEDQIGRNPLQTRGLLC
jgi:hypothetical protein